MTKAAQTQVEIHTLLKERWSPRAFCERDVELSALRSLFEAARWAPSSGNGQPWAFVYALKGSDGFRAILAALDEGNANWAARAPVLCVTTLKRFHSDGRLIPHALYDLGQATAHLSVQATALGLFVHQMAGCDVSQVARDLGIPFPFEAVTALAIGYLGDPGVLPEKLRDREMAVRSRKPVEEFVFANHWPL